MDSKLKYMNNMQLIDKGNIDSFKQKFDENPKREKLMKIIELKLMSEILKSSTSKIKLPDYKKINTVQVKKNFILSEFSNTRCVNLLNLVDEFDELSIKQSAKIKFKY